MPADALARRQFLLPSRRAACAAHALQLPCRACAAHALQLPWRVVRLGTRQACPRVEAVPHALLGDRSARRVGEETEALAFAHAEFEEEGLAARFVHGVASRGRMPWRRAQLRPAEQTLRHAAERVAQVCESRLVEG